MEEQRKELRESDFGFAAIYQPSQGENRRMVTLVLLLLVVLLIGIATRAQADEKPSDHAVLQDVIYSASSSHDSDNRCC